MNHEDIKKHINLAEYVRSCGIELTGNGTELKARCPFPDHEDKTPSFFVNTAKQVFNCFGCGRKGSVIDFVKDYENLTTAETLKKLSESIKPINGRKFDSIESIFRIEASPLLDDVAEYYHRALFGKDTQGLDYLKRRGIHDIEMLKHFQVGFVTGSLPRVLSKDRIEELKECGVLNEKNREFFTGCVVVPLKNTQKQVVGFYGRSTSNGRHLYLPGPHRGLMNADCVAVYDDVILAESVIDALSIYQAGKKNVIPCYGTSGFTPLHDRLIHNAGKPVVIAFDNDQAGKTAADKLSAQLKQKGIKNGILQWPDGVKDANEFFTYNNDINGRRTLEDFDKLLKKVKWSTPNVVVPSGNREDRKKQSRSAKYRLDLVKHTGSELLYSTGRLFYKLRGLYLNSVTSLKLVVTVSKDPVIGPESVTLTDRFDLYLVRNRGAFAHRAGEKFDIPAALIDDDLNRLIPKLEILREERNKGDDDPDQRPEMTDAEKDNALKFLKNPNLLGRITTDLETLGYAGEDIAKQLCYIIATSRKLSKPLSCIIRSESGAGKSYLMELVAELMPDENVEYFSRLTPQSLYYMGKDRLVHKLLIVDERNGSEESEYPIRTLQTRRKLTLAVPRKDDKGNMTTTILEINGPIAYMESTTSDYLNPENANRCFEIFLDESQNQTSKIFSFQRQSKTMAGWKRERRKEHVIQRHQNAQRLLQPVKIIIPYAELIDFPVSWTRGRRDHERFLNLIEAIAFLHQYQRPSKKNEESQAYIEADINDYKIAYKLAKTVFTHCLSELPKNAASVHEQIKAMVAENTQKLGIPAKDYGFRRRDIREYTQMPNHQIKRAMTTLEDLEYVEVRRKGRGGSHIYRLLRSDTEVDIMQGVTTPDSLKKKLESGQ